MLHSSIIEAIENYCTEKIVWQSLSHFGADGDVADSHPRCAVGLGQTVHLYSSFIMFCIDKEASLFEQKTNTSAAKRFKIPMWAKHKTRRTCYEKDGNDKDVVHLEQLRQIYDKCFWRFI